MAHDLVGRTAQANDQGHGAAQHQRWRDQDEGTEEVEGPGERLDPERVLDLRIPGVDERTRLEPDPDHDQREPDTAQP